MHTAKTETVSTRSSTYDALAGEYYDASAHPTCHNLNRLSRLFIERHFPEPWNGRATVEVGAGDSCVAALLHSRGYSLAGLQITDSSTSMIEHSRRWVEYGATLTTCDASSFGTRFGAASLVVASLGDPYNTPAFWIEAFKGVRVGGRILFTSPSFEWSSRFRAMTGEASQVAEFTLKDGSVVQVPSIIIPLDEQIRLFESSGFMLVAFESLGAESLHPNEPRSPKIDVFGKDASSIVWGFDLVRRSSQRRASNRSG